MRQTIDIATGSDTRAAGIQNVLSDMCKGAAALALAQVLDRHAGARVLRIERLELDLGRISGPDWQDLFLARLRAAAEDGLARVSRWPEAEEDAAREAPRGRAIGRSEVTPAATRLEALRHYLMHGWLPWWSDLAAAPGWVAKLVADLPLGAQGELAIRAAAHPQTLERLVLALSDEQMARLLARGLPTAPRRAAAGLAAALVPRGAPGRLRHELRWRFWQSVLDLHVARPRMVAPHRGDSSERWASLFADAQALGTAAPRLRAVLRAMPEGYRQDFLVALRARRVGARAPSEGQPTGSGGESEAAATGDAGPASQVSSEMLARAPGADKALRRDPQSRTVTARSRAETDQTRIPVADAGLVLVHPFLAELFSRSGYLDDGSFAVAEARHRAVRLLGHVAFGTVTAEEAHLVLAKVLVGLAPEAVLLPDLPDDEACAAADRMLAAVLGHWRALHSASPDWLRSEFLLRPGLLSHTDGGPVLVVETRAQDVLIGRLPWGFGLIALPWMERPLSVRWID